MLSWFYINILCANSSCNAEIDPYFTFPHCPEWHTAVIKCPVVFCVKFRASSVHCFSSPVPMCLLLKTSTKGHKPQLLAKSSSNPTDKYHPNWLRDFFFPSVLFPEPSRSSDSRQMGNLKCSGEHIFSVILDAIGLYISRLALADYYLTEPRWCILKA